MNNRGPSSCVWDRLDSVSPGEKRAETRDAAEHLQCSLQVREDGGDAARMRSAGSDGEARRRAQWRSDKSKTTRSLRSLD